MSDYLALLRIAVAGAVATMVIVTASYAVELAPTAVIYKTPDQFQWRDPTDQVATNQTILYGDPTKPGLYIYINKFKPNRFGNAHYHPNDRFITVIEGAGWRGTGPVVDPAHATRLPKGSFSIDHAMKVHWDGTKEETGAYLIAGYGPATNIEVPKNTGPYADGDPSALALLTPDQIPWMDYGGNRVATLAGDPEKPGLLRANAHVEKGQFQPSAFSPKRPLHHGTFGHLVGRHRRQVRSRASDGPDEAWDLRHRPRERRALGWRQGRGHDDPHHRRRPGNDHAGRRGEIE